MKVLVSVFNNLLTDQRVEKVCRTLYENGYDVELIGNNWGGLPEMSRPYKFSRLHLKSKSLKLAYPEFNFKLAQELKKKANKNTILLSNDLDTLAANYWISKKMKLPLVYDSHEIYVEMPSLNGRPTKKIWSSLEKKILPKLKFMMAANESYAKWYAEKYTIETPVVVRNFPRKMGNPQNYEIVNAPKIILYQGAINPSRGLDKLIPAMKRVENAQLWIAGKGPKLEEYQALTKSLQLTEKIKFLGSISPEELRAITTKADVGLSIEENGGLSYFYSLPNKISDYIQARVPVVTSNFPEMEKIVNQYNVGTTIKNHTEQELVSKINDVLSLGKAFYKNHLEKAATDLCWENEEAKLLQLFAKVKDSCH